MPDRDYYFHQGKEKERNVYLEYLKKMYQMTNLNIDPKDIYNIEEKLAKRISNKNRRENLKKYTMFIVLNLYKTFW